MNRAAAAIAAAVAICLTLVGQMSTAHEWTMPNGQTADARWIRKHFSYCCGERDCFPIRARRVRFTPAGWRVAGIPGTAPEKDVHHSSPDGRPWACVYGTIGRPLGIRCLFLPGARQ